ncbi:MAG TPA: sigma 54-interacting transcriptional regulator [Bacillales bacterium]|nr:sigma 54-interacting transcriptional regulator [Bacillales bacterium]
MHAFPNGLTPFYLDSVLTTDNDTITAINTNWEVLFWNQAAEQTYNISEKQIVGEKITEYFKTEDLMVLQVLKTGKAVRQIYHRPREDKHVFINSSPVYDSDHRLIGAVSIEQDITHTVLLNEKLSATSTQLNEYKHKVYQRQLETPFAKLQGESAAMQRTIQLAVKAAKTNATVLILGESGTGKELCARAIHETSPRRDQPFIPINCGAIPHALFESELFGYERGAFTGASKEGKTGKIEAADGGTLFLDEIGELPLEMQVKLLRVLQENIVYRIGGSTGNKVNVRIIAATNRDLDQMMEEERFRSDLFYRLNVIQINIPPLRDRLEDIPELVTVFLKELEVEYQMSGPSLKDETMQMLLQYDWPGNVRELRNIIERALILSEQKEIGKRELLGLFPQKAGSVDHPNSLSDEKQVLEKERIESALTETYGNKSAAARKLGISRVSLYKKIHKYNISWETKPE